MASGIQSCKPEKADASLVNIKGHDYYKDTFVPPAEDVTEIDPRDKGTPDDWVPRHPELVRLTGRHPFNVEPPVWRIKDHGFISPNSLHYVRNHGAVPRIVQGDSHKVRFGGAIDKPMEMSVEYIKANFKEITIPVTLVCAGNRRKEENMIKQGLGFSWGPAAVSNAMWTGVWVKDILKHIGIKSYEEGAKHVCFVGADKLPNGYYGTSIRREVCMDETADVLLAYKMNGKELSPDHGYPIRLIVPGYIGGRMIKWITDIEVTDLESDNHYHYFDNRVLPSQVDAEKAVAEGWWYKPPYIINELNINSAVVYPRHGEVLSLTSTDATYTVSGYAYGGGGIGLTRVEVSFDDGKTWELTEMCTPEKPRHMGRYWCWVFWEFKVDVLRMMKCEEIVCRAWQGQNTQPQNITWNLLGMMNNCWFRCKVHPTRDDRGALALTFEHPTMPGGQPGGWMVKGDSAVVAAAPVAKAASNGRKINLQEVQKHDNEDDCWIAVDGKVYDVTDFLDDHPGGGESITISAGQDSSDEFNALHSDKARAMLLDYYIGELDSSVEKPPKVIQEEVEVALNTRQKLAVPLIEKEVLSSDSRRFRFGLPTKDHKLGLPIGKHFFVSGRWNGEFVMRPYTPVTGDEVTGFVDLVIKVYTPNDRFPNGGKMSQLLDSLDIGDTIDIKGPVGEIAYLEPGQFLIKGKPRNASKLAMLAGGTGITPMYQVLKAVLNNPDDNTECSLIYANQTEDAILLRDELDAMAKAHPNQFNLWYTLDRPEEDWTYGKGFISAEMCKEQLPAASDDTIAFMCGPPAMIKFACIPNLTANGYSSTSHFNF
uniref:Nitrate reductase n=2 Tax=Saccharina japonica TaxID=88149 RepID=A0A977LL34_SACJA|nr:nitrate reductase [Saccharina japonica]